MDQPQKEPKKQSIGNTVLKIETLISVIETEVVDSVVDKGFGDFSEKEVAYKSVWLEPELRVLKRKLLNLALNL